jgi:Asp/Glu/hydantoin racemase
MRILAITPIAVDDEELARRQARYDRLAPAAVSVHLEHLGTGSEVPRALETSEDIAASDAVLLERYASADASRYDAFLPDCVLDPVVEHAEELPLPVHGIGRLSAHYLAGLGLSIGAVARNEAIATELDRKLVSYGVVMAKPTAVMDLTVEDIADEATWAAAVEGTVASLGCQAVINACSAVNVTERTNGPVLVDPTATALNMLAGWEKCPGE